MIIVVAKGKRDKIIPISSFYVNNIYQKMFFKSRVGIRYHII